jgi:hypothetical protein
MVARVPALRTTPDFARTLLRADAIFGGAVGLLLIACARPLGAFVGFDRPLVLMVLGVAFLPYVAALYLGAGRERLRRRLLLLQAIANGVGALGIGVVLFGGTSWLTLGGWWTIAALADVAALFAVAQLYALRRAG